MLRTVNTPPAYASTKKPSHPTRGNVFWRALTDQLLDTEPAGRYFSL